MSAPAASRARHGVLWFATTLAIITDLDRVCMNMVGNAAGAVAPMVLAATHNNWTVNIALFATAYFLGAVCWAFIDSDERLHQ